MPGERLEENIIPASEWVAAVKPLLDEGFELKICPSGLSMYPFLAGGRDEVILMSAAYRAPVRGDIVLFSRVDGVHILHRVHHVKKGSFYMLGDAQTWIEGPIARENVHAVAVAVIRKNKKTSCDSFSLKLMVHIWLILRPVRPLFIRSRHAFNRLFRT